MRSVKKSRVVAVLSLAAMLALFACAAPRPPVSSLPASVAPDMKVVTLDEAMNRTLIRAMPLNIAVPEAYKLFPDEPYHGNHLWTTQKNYDALQKNGTSDRSEGALQLRISLDIGYDRASDSFICGPGCGEAQLSAKMEEAGFKLTANDRRSVNGVPVWFIEAEPQKGGDTLYMAYLGTLIETNAVVLTWGPPMDQAQFGKETWAAIKNAIVTSPPDSHWIESTTRGDRRKTPPITMMTKIPPGTARVRKCVEGASTAARKLNYKVDLARAAEGFVVVVTDETDPVTLTMRFVDFGSEILLASSAKASGNAMDTTVPVQKAFYGALAEELGDEYPIQPLEDMMEQLYLLGPQ